MNPDVTVVINHLGTPFKRLGGRWNGLWEGMAAFVAAGDHVFIKISMLGYVDPEWDQNPLVIDAILRVIDLFGVHRCLQATIPLTI